MGEAVGKQFCEFYYNTFDSNRQGLGPLYREQSCLTFETNQIMGATPIIQKLVELPFTKVAHKVTTLDAQPVGQTGQILVQVTGQLLIDDGEHPQNFTQTFLLAPEGGSFFVLNDIFRLVYL